MLRVTFARKIVAAFACCMVGTTAIGIAAPSLTPTAGESSLSEAASSWGNHLSSEVGTLINPPVGRVPEEIRETERVLNEIVTILAGDEFKARNKRWVVSIYANPEPNAFALEAQWPTGLPGYDGKEVSKSGLHTYEIGITTGLLKMVESVDQLAFVLSHEITHLLEGHTKNLANGGGRTDPTREERLRKWWSQQRFEVIADNLGLKRMVGKFKLQAAVEALEKLSALNPSSASDEYDSGASTHHHEGPRIALAQGYADYLIRSDENAWRFDDSPIPEFMKISAGKRVKVADTRSPDFDKNKKKLKAWLMGDILSDDFLKKGFTERDLRNRRNQWSGTPGSAIANGKEPSPKQVSETLLEAVSLLSANPQLNGQQRIDAFLRLAIFLESISRRPIDRGKAWRIFNDQERRQIKLFFAKNTRGEQGWKGKLFFESARRVINSLEQVMFAHYLELALFASAPEVQLSILNDVYKIRPEPWDELFSEYTAVKTITESGEFSIKRLLRHIISLARKQSPLSWVSTFNGPLQPVLQRHALRYLERLSPEELTHNIIERGFERGTFDFWQVGSLLDTATQDEPDGSMDERFLKEVRDRMRPFAQEFVKWRDKRALEYFSGNQFDRVYANFFARSFFNSLKPYPPAPSSRPQLISAFARFAEIASIEPLITDGRSAWHNNESYDFFGDLLNDRSIPLARRQAVFKTLLSATSGGVEATLPNIPESARVKFASYLSEIGIKGVLQTTTSTIPSIKKFYREVLKEHYRLDSNDENWLSLIKKIVDSGKVKEDLAPELDLQFRPELSSNSRTAVLAYLATDLLRPENVTAQASLEDLRTLIKNIRAGVVEGRILRNFWSSSFPYRSGFANNFSLGLSSVEALFVILRNVDGQIASTDDWFKLFKSIHDFNSLGLEQSGNLKKQIQNRLMARLDLLAPEEVYAWMKKDWVLKYLDSNFISRHLLRKMAAEIQDTDRETLGRAVAKADKDLTLQKKYPDAFVVFRDDLAKAANLQPKDLHTVFPPLKSKAGKLTQQTAEFSSHVRGLSFMVAKTRQRSWPEQLAFIDYITDRSDQMPAFVIEDSRKSDDSDAKIPFDVVATGLRDRLQHESAITRIMVVNSFLAGPNSPMSTEQGEAFLLDRILDGVKAENRELAEVIAKAVLHAQGKSRSLAFAYILGQPIQRNEESSDKEARILHSLFSAFGVPGIKLGQYLGFTAGLSKYARTMESLQDEAMPLDYFHLLKLIESRFGSDWPEKYRVVGLIGSGSVNVAIELEDIASGQRDVAQIARDKIETSTTEDFRRFELALNYILALPKFGAKFGFIRGLMNIIAESVKLEFDKKHVFEMQKFAETLYNTERRGWKVRTVPASEFRNMTVFMRKAVGRSARKVYRENPGAYREAMLALGDVEWDILMGVKTETKIQPLPLLANPDFHDGQVLIDEATRTVTLLDFGQALVTSNEERDLAIELLKVIAGSQSISASAKELNRILSKAGLPEKLTESEVRELVATGDRMDIFIRLVAKLNLKGYNVPLPTVHWILGLNRGLVLSEKIGGSKELSVKMLLLTQKFGFSLRTFNNARSLFGKWLQYVSWEPGNDTKSYSPRSCKKLFKSP